MKNNREFLLWLISPKNEKEDMFLRELFKENINVLDRYCYIKNNINTMSDEEVKEEINIDLQAYNLELK